MAEKVFRQATDESLRSMPSFRVIPKAFADEGDRVDAMARSLYYISPMYEPIRIILLPRMQIILLSTPLANFEQPTRIGRKGASSHEITGF